MKETKVKKMYKIIFIFTIVLLYIFIGKVYANSINDIDMLMLQKLGRNG